MGSRKSRDAIALRRNRSANEIQNQLREYILDIHLFNGAPVEGHGFTDTPLRNVAYWGERELLRRMIDLGADVNRSSEDGRTPLLSAAWAGEVECVKVLLKAGADPYAPFTSSPFSTATTVWETIRERGVENGAKDSHREAWAAVSKYMNSRVPAEDLE